MTSILEILPLSETIDQIIDTIADNDGRSSGFCATEEDKIAFELPNLNSCFRTCRTFATRCRRRLYRSVVLFDTWNSQRQVPSLARSFADVITRTPEIAENVRELIYFMRPVAVASEDEDGSAVPVAPGPPVALEALVNLNLLFLNVETGTWPELVRSPWWPLISKFMSSPTLKDIAFGRNAMLRHRGLGDVSSHSEYIFRRLFFAGRQSQSTIDGPVLFIRDKRTQHFVEVS